MEHSHAVQFLVQCKTGCLLFLFSEIYVALSPSATLTPKSWNVSWEDLPSVLNV